MSLLTWRVRESCSLPSPTPRTPLTAPLKEDKAVYDAIRARTPMGRFGRMEELVGPCVFLCSDASSLVTGTSLLVDGGWYAG